MCSFKSINSSARPLTLEERLNILYEIYNDDKDPFISKQKQIDEANKAHEEVLAKKELERKIKNVLKNRQFL